MPDATDLQSDILSLQKRKVQRAKSIELEKQIRNYFVKPKFSLHKIVMNEN